MARLVLAAFYIRNVSHFYFTTVLVINISDTPQVRNIDKSAGTKKRHLRLSSKMAFLFVSERNLHGEATAKEVGVRLSSVWWSGCHQR